MNLLRVTFSSTFDPPHTESFFYETDAAAEEAFKEAQKAVETNGHFYGYGRVSAVEQYIITDMNLVRSVRSTTLLHAWLICVERQSGGLATFSHTTKERADSIYQHYLEQMNDAHAHDPIIGVSIYEIAEQSVKLLSREMKIVVTAPIDTTNDIFRPDGGPR